MHKVLEKEGLTLQEIEELEGGPIFENENGSDYRLTVENNNDRDDYQQQFKENTKDRNLIKDIQNQVIKEQEDEMLS